MVVLATPSQTGAASWRRVSFAGRGPSHRFVAFPSQLLHGTHSPHHTASLCYSLKSLAARSLCGEGGGEICAMANFVPVQNARNRTAEAKPRSGRGREIEKGVGAEGSAFCCAKPEAPPLSWRACMLWPCCATASQMLAVSPAIVSAHASFAERPGANLDEEVGIVPRHTIDAPAGVPSPDPRARDHAKGASCPPGGVLRIREGPVGQLRQPAK